MSFKLKWVRPRRVVSGVAVVATAGALAACGSSSNGSGSSGSTSSPKSGAPLNVLAIVDTSGPDKSVGSQIAAGLNAAAHYQNSKGGILGHKVEVTTVDDQGDPTTATSVAIKALSSDPGKYAMVYAGEEGTVTAALIPVLKRYGVLSIAASDGAGTCAVASACPTQFDMEGPATLSTVSGAQWFAKKGIKNVGILSEQIDFTENELPGFVSQLKKLGIKSETVGFPATATSVTPELSELKSKGAQAIYGMAFGAPAGYIANARAGLGWDAPLLYDIAGSSLDLSTLAKPQEYKNAYESAFYCMNTANNVPGINLMFKNQTTPIVGTNPCTVAGQGWTGITLLHDAAVKAQSVSSKAMLAAMTSITSTTPSSPVAVYHSYCWTKTDHENQCMKANNFQILPVGKIVKTRLAPLSGS